MSQVKCKLCGLITTDIYAESAICPQARYSKYHNWEDKPAAEWFSSLQKIGYATDPPTFAIICDRCRQTVPDNPLYADHYWKLHHFLGACCKAKAAKPEARDSSEAHNPVTCPTAIHYGESECPKCQDLWFKPKAAEPIPTASELQQCGRCGKYNEHECTAEAQRKWRIGAVQKPYFMKSDALVDSTADEAKGCPNCRHGHTFGQCNECDCKTAEPPAATTEHEAIGVDPKHLIFAEDYPPPPSGGKGWQRAGDILYATPENTQPPADATSLSLLIVDLGESVAVRIEQGDFNRLDIPAIYWQNDTCGICAMPFEKVRESLDALDKPLPRVERDGDNAYRFQFRDGSMTFGAKEFADITAINNGVELPVFEPGTWTQILNITDDYDVPFNVWRFTK